MKLNFNYKKGKGSNLYDDAIKLRKDIFVIEQECFDTPDEDDFDDIAYHIVGYYENETICCARVFFDEEILLWGRIAVDKKYRGKNLGVQLLNYLKEFSFDHLKSKEVHIHAEYYAMEFYKKFGFIEYGDVYIFDNIEHINMKLEF
ncbi:GNAT family N-acetyltransferase [Spiroplasma tabanidicola]|uniref:ElaA protein n=1 Tax=Spiroplasma tabanidicola TaxID=324079 RepID=A0A6I6CEI4_9MOLU|nr:GNAT family N-acetyltransferase [Spiroplasma tabanidicola]QGS52384.1 ElaA protein [Spiroplasma tabanidicola]